MSKKMLSPTHLEAKEFAKSFGTPLIRESKKHGICLDCGLLKPLTEHHLKENDRFDGVCPSSKILTKILICRKCHDKREGIVPRRSPEKQTERLLKRGMRFTEQSLGKIRQDKRWVQIADKWTDAEQKEMLNYLRKKRKASL